MTTKEDLQVTFAPLHRLLEERKLRGRPDVEQAIDKIYDAVMQTADFEELVLWLL